MIACVDVAYTDATAYAAGITFRDWTDASAFEERLVQLSNVQEYEPGQFFPTLLKRVDRLCRNPPAMMT